MLKTANQMRQEGHAASTNTQHSWLDEAAVTPPSFHRAHFASPPVALPPPRSAPPPPLYTPHSCNRIRPLPPLYPALFPALLPSPSRRSNPPASLVLAATCPTQCPEQLLRALLADVAISIISDHCAQRVSGLELCPA